MAFCPCSWPLGPGSWPLLIEKNKDWRLNGKEKEKKKKEKEETINFSKTLEEIKFFTEKIKYVNKRCNLLNSFFNSFVDNNF